MKVLPSGKRRSGAWAIDESYGGRGRSCKRCESKGADHDDDDKDDGDGDNDDDVESFCPGDSCWGRAQGEQVEDHRELGESTNLNILHTKDIIW